MNLLQDVYFEQQTQTSKILDMELMTGIPELAEAFKKQSEHYLQDMENSGQDVHKRFLLSLIRRQQAFLSQFDEKA